MNDTTQNSDIRIIEKIRTGDRDEFSGLFRQYYEPLCFFAVRFTRDSDAAENIVQEIFFKLWDIRHTLQLSSSLKGYLYTAVKNSCLNYLRHEGKFTSLEFEDERIDTTFPAPDTQLERDELAEALERAIEQLPPKCRQIFSLARLDNLSYQEISEVQGVSINTVKTQLKRATKTLMKSLQHLYLTFMVWVQ